MSLGIASAGRPPWARLAALAALSALGYVTVAWAGGSWESRPSLITPRQETGGARIGDSVYVVGGLIDGGGATNTVEVYNPTTNGPWSFVAPMPLALHHVAVAVLDRKLYVMGGYTGSFTPVNSVSIYDPSANSWSAGPTLPSTRAAAWAVTHDNTIYLFGGVVGGAATNSVLKLVSGGGAWSPVASPMPTAREHLTAVSDGTYIYVIGGRSGGSTHANERFHPGTSQWQTMAPVPTARSAMGTAHFAGRIHVVGGEVPMLFDAHEVYHIGSNTWTAQPPMPTPRHGLAAVALDDRILFPGGGTAQGIGPTDLVDSFIPNTPVPGTGPRWLIALGALLAAGASLAMVRGGFARKHV